MKTITMKLTFVAFSTILFIGMTIKSNLSDFEINIDSSAQNSIMMKCEKECAWKELEISCEDNECEKKIAEYGTYSPDFNDQSKKLDPFIIEISRKNNSYSFSCTEGCAWIELTTEIAKPENVIINLTQYGVSLK